MSTYIRTGRGSMDLDNNPYRVNELGYIDAQNITRDGSLGAEDGVISNIRGNVLVGYTLPDGTNKVIGAKEDLIRNRLYYFVWNSQGKHSILYYNLVTKAVVKLLEDITDTYYNDEILKFNPSFRINHIDIIYRDEGDLLYFTDGNTMPKGININYIVELQGLAVGIRYTDIEFARQPPLIPPFCWYQRNRDVIVNNLKKNLFKFKYRYVYNDFTKSTTSGQGYLPLPIQEDLSSSKPEYNGMISIAFVTGEKNVKKIELLASYNIGEIFSDYFLIKVIDKEELGLEDNSVGIFDFFNNEAYSNIDVNESILDFDRVPQKALTQANANGNTIEYANILEGYDNPIVPNSTTFSPQTSLTYRNYLTGNIYCYQNGDSTNKVFNPKIEIVAFGYFERDTVVSIKTTNFDLVYLTTGTTTNNQLLIELRDIAIGFGFSAVVVSGKLVITKTTPDTEYLLGFSCTAGNSTILNADFKSSISCYDWWTRHSFGVVFYDKKGKTNGVVFPTNNDTQMGEYALQESPTNNFMPLLAWCSINLDLVTPDWAYSYQIVRTKRLNKGYFIQWVSDITIKELGSGALNKNYAYIGINSLDAFILENPASSYLGYSFTPKDRIRFIANGMQSNGNATNIYDANDYEIIDYVANPTINGIEYKGKYIKIGLPTTTATFDFGVEAFYNYFIEVYKPTLPTSNGLDIYYEFGISQKCLPSQSINRVLPNYIGDCYGRFRDISLVPTIKYKFDRLPSNNTIPTGRLTIGATNVNTILPSNSYTPTNEQFGQPLPPSSTQILNITDDKAHTFNLKGNIELHLYNVINTDPVSFKVKALNGSSITADVLLFSSISFDGFKTFEFDVQINCPIGTKQLLICYEYYPGVTTNFTMDIKTGFFTLTENIKQVRQFCIDPNFSDYYTSAVNSNGRGFIHDVNATQQWLPSTIRFGREFQQNTNINQINRFYADNFDDYDRSNGSIQKLFIDGRRLYVMQQFDIGVVPVLQQIVQDVTGNPLQANSDKLLNKIQYPYQAKIGIGNVPESFAHSMNTIFGVDNNKGVIWALNLNGVNELSQVYKIDALINKITPIYNTSLNNGIGVGGAYLGNPTIIGGYDYYTNRYWVSFEEVKRFVNEQMVYQAPLTLTFADTKDDTRGFECRVTWFPEYIKSIGNLMCSFKEGKLYTHNNSNFCRFGGEQFSASITFVFNGSQQIKKTFRSVEQLSDIAWDIPFIETSSSSNDLEKQESELKSIDFKKCESGFMASFLRDKKSKKGLFGGDLLKGNYIILKMEVPTQKSGIYHFLNMVQIKATESHLNLK